MQFIKSLIFNIFLYFGLISIFILAIPTLFLPSKFTIFFWKDVCKIHCLNFKTCIKYQGNFSWKRKLKKG